MLGHGRAGRNLKRLAQAVVFAALVIRRSMLLLTPMDGWHHFLGEAMIVSEIVGIVLAAVSAMRRDDG